jgi:hypothetical protein
MVIQKIEAGKPSATGDYGVYSYNYKSTDPKITSKDNTLGWMNYTIGYIMYYRQNQKKDALPYLYKATQINAATKTNPEPYRIIGSWYVDEIKRLDDDRIAKVKAAGDKDTDETKNLLAMEKGYADRAIDAYSRAYKLASSDPKDKAYKDSLLTVAKQIYDFRYNKDMSGFDAYLAGVTNKPFTDPTTAVVPVVEETPTTATTTPSTATTMTNTTAAPSTATRPTVVPTTASTTSTTKTTTATTTTKTTTAKAPAKKVVAKKKN